jgi:hypothetical protein
MMEEGTSITIKFLGDDSKSATAATFVKNIWSNEIHEVKKL